MITLRPYQATALEELWAWLYKHHTGNPIVDASVGAGKSLLIAAVAQRCEREAPGTRVLVLVHQKELLAQNLEKLKAIWPEADVGIVSAAMGRKQLGHQITYATIGSIHKMAHKLGRVDLIMADECFSPGTLVSTPRGPVPIELLNPGDEVLNACGLGVITAARASLTKEIYVVRLSNGARIQCTGNHPFFTADGWVPARLLARGARVFSVEEVRELRRRVQAMDHQGGLHTGGGLDQAEVLLDLLLEEEREPDAHAERAGGNGSQAAGDWAPAVAARRQWLSAHADGAWPAVLAGRRVGVGPAYPDAQTQSLGLAESLQAGHQPPDIDDVSRSGRRVSCGPTLCGPEEGRFFEVVGVERVQGHSGGRGAVVHNIQVSGHPSYFAAGVLVHNCHLISPKESGMWRGFLKDLRLTCPNARVIGWTGTPFRGNGIWLTAGEEALFTAVATRVTMTSLLEQGYLAPLVPAKTNARIATDGVRTSGDDYVVHELAKVTDTEPLVAATCDEIVVLGAARKRWLVFAVTLEHAGHVRDALRARGVAAEVVSGDTPKTERDKLFADYRKGAYRCLVNVGVATTGFDVPEVDFIALLRATKSPVLYVQIGGRGMRCVGQGIAESIANGKADCLWADFTSTTVDMGPIDKVEGRMPSARGGGEAPFKLCPKCGSQNAAGASVCSSCGHEFPPPEKIKHTDGTNGAQVLSTGAPMLKEVGVRSAYYSVHTKEGSPPTMRVEYMDGIKVIAREWVCFDHQGYARRKAEAWWAQRSSWPPPPDVASAVAYASGGGLRLPAQLSISTAGKYPEIVGVQFEREMA